MFRCYWFFALLAALSVGAKPLPTPGTPFCGFPFPSKICFNKPWKKPSRPPRPPPRTPPQPEPERAEPINVAGPQHAQLILRIPIPERRADPAVGLYTDFEPPVRIYNVEVYRPSNDDLWATVIQEEQSARSGWRVLFSLAYFSHNRGHVFRPTSLQRPISLGLIQIPARAVNDALARGAMLEVEVVARPPPGYHLPDQGEPEDFPPEDHSPGNDPPGHH